MQWRRPEEKETMAAIRKAKGSGGPHGWTGEEVRAMPEEAAKLFHQMAERWEEAEEVPKASTEARQVNLPKPGKAKKGKLNAAHTRPITVFSVLWRIYAGTWVTGESVAAWRAQAMPEEIVGGTCTRMLATWQRWTIHCVMT